MQIDAVYDNGELILTRHLRLAKLRFAVRIEVPDEMVLAEESHTTPLPSTEDPWLQRLAALHQEALDAQRSRSDTLPDKQAQRLAAFGMRENI